MNTNLETGQTLLNDFNQDGMKVVIDGLNTIAPHIGRYIFEFYGHFTDPTLNPQQREMITLAVLTTLSDCASELKFHTNFSLNIGITPEEIVEIITHCIPFIGFPRTLNAIKAAGQVFAERGLVVEIADELKNETAKFEKGIAMMEEIQGEHGRAVLKSLETIAPKLGENMIGFTFGEIYRRSALDVRQRQLITLGSLTAQGDCGPQLNAHINTAFNVGLPEEQIIEALLQCALYVGFPKVLNALDVLKQYTSEK